VTVLWLIGLTLLGGCNRTIPRLPGGTICGMWGGGKSVLLANDTSAHLHIGCTYGNIHQPIIPDGKQRFAVPGEYNLQAYPVNRGILHPATFRGVVRGKKMQVTVELRDTAVTLGPVALVFGQSREPVPCPRCRLEGP